MDGQTSTEALRNDNKRYARNTIAPIHFSFMSKFLTALLDGRQDNEQALEQSSNSYTYGVCPVPQEEMRIFQAPCIADRTSG